MRYKEIKPPQYLQHIVRLFFMYEEEEGASSRMPTYRIIADGCPGLIFQYSGKSTVFCDQNGTPVPRSFLYGQSTAPVNIYSSEPVQIFGAYFQPWVISVLFGFGADKLTNSLIDFSLINSVLESRIIEAGSFAQRTGIVSEFIHSNINYNSRPNYLIQEVAEQISQTGGSIDLRHLYSNSYLSERTLVRAFKKQVGITPKHFSKIIRFQSAMNLIRERNVTSFSDMANKCGYSDQSHFIRDFKTFSGFTPTQFSRQYREMISKYHQLS
jgi:AraC-like DNA-binding protein